MSNGHKITTVDGIEIITIIRPQATKTVMLLHGFGASFEDLAPLARYLDPKSEWNWIFPNGTLEVPLGPHMVGRAWFPIRISELEAAAMLGEAVDFADTLPDGMKSAEQKILSLLNHLHIVPKDLVLGGFSQGAMMAVQTALNLPASVRGLLLFSGTLINRKEWIEKLPLHKQTPYLLSHGRSDPILGFQHATKLHKTLRDAGLNGDFVEFNGGHEIPMTVLQRAIVFLQQCL